MGASDHTEEKIRSVEVSSVQRCAWSRVRLVYPLVATKVGNAGMVEVAHEREHAEGHRRALLAPLAEAVESVKRPVSDYREGK